MKSEIIEKKKNAVLMKTRISKISSYSIGIYIPKTIQKDFKYGDVVFVMITKGKGGKSGGRKR